MKCKLIVAVSLCLALLCTVGTAFAVSEADKILARDGTQGFWDLVLPSYDGELIEKDHANVRVWSPDSPVTASVQKDVAAQCMYDVRMQETAGVGFTITSIDVYFYENGADQFRKSRPVEMSGIYIPPYGSYEFGAGNPRQGNPRYEVYAVNGVDDFGHELAFYGIVERLNIIENDASTMVALNPAYDVNTLRHEASFAVEVHDDIYWVPAASLGQSRYTNQEIAEMVNLTPEEKQEKISTLYEAIQLYQISNFANADDNKRIKEKKINWEHHKPGYQAVRTNQGCCATNSNWLNYILKDDYDEVGFMAYSNTDGSGHIFNYIRQGDDYYYIDLTHYRTDFLETAEETGVRDDYYAVDYIAGNIHRTASPEAYTEYCVEKFNNPPGLFFQYQAEDCLPVDGVKVEDGICITYPNNVEITVVYDDERDDLTCQFVDPPKKSVSSWGKKATFKVDKKYKQAPEALEAHQSPWTVGQTMTLEDYAETGRFVIVDGVDFTPAWNEWIRTGFESDLTLYGGNNYSYFGFTFPVNRYTTRLEGMESLVLGQWMLDVETPLEFVTLARCTEQDGMLTVQEIRQDWRSYTEQIAIERDNSGTWQELAPQWYLIEGIVDGKPLYWYAKINCEIEQ